MNKHLSMLFAAAVALCASPAFAACPTSTTCDDVTTVLSSPIQTQTAGPSNSPDNILIESSGGVKVKQAGAAVTVNSSNYLVNDGTITNAGIAGAQGIVINAITPGTLDTTLTSQKGVSNAGTIDLTGGGDNKIGILLENGTMIGPLTLNANSTIKVTGDGSRAIEVASTGILQGDMTLDGTITLTPTNPSALTAPVIPLAAVDIEGLVNGNVSSTAAIASSGAGSQGIRITGQICDALGCASATRTANDFGTLTNLGSVTVLGKVGQGVPTSTVLPEGGSALIVSNNIEGGISNGSAASSAALLSGSGFTFVSGGGATINAVVSITSPGTAVTIGEDTSDPVNSPNFSFLNFGTIAAEPSSANASTTAINVAGASSTGLTTLTGGFFNQGNISAIATTSTGANAANAAATAILFNNFSVVPVVEISNASGAGTVAAGVSGAAGGNANAIVFQSTANNADPTTHPATIDVLTGARILASATTTNPLTVGSLNAVGILDESGTVTTINNAGTISATVTTLTSDKNAAGFSNQARAIDLSKNSVGGITINNSGTITGDVLLNGTQSGVSPTVVVIGTGAATGADAAQIAAATNAKAMPTPFGANPGGTGVSNSAANKATLTGAIEFGSGTSKLYINDFGVVSGAILSAGTLDVGVAQNGFLDVTNTGSTCLTVNQCNMTVHTLNVYGVHATLDITITDSLRQLGEATIQGEGAGTAINIDSGSALGVKIASFVPQPTVGNFVEYKLIEGPTGTVNIPDLAIYQTGVENNLPFYFNRDADCLTGAVQTNCSLKFKNSGGDDQVVLDLRPKSAAQLGLLGDAATLFGPVNTALGKIADDQLGAAIINGIHDQNSAEQVFSQFAPDVSGNQRAIAVALTDQASGPVAARQRILRMYANQGGDFTLWGQEYAQYINDKGNTVGGGLTNFKDHGFGFAIGADGGDPIDGWYGGAITYFAGDATETDPRNAKAQTDWYMLTGYTDWRGHHLFLDTQASVALAHITARRTLTITDQNNVTLITREADSKRPGLLGALGATTGAIFNLGNVFLMPEISLDGLTLREEGFKEQNGGDGFDLQVQPYYTTSLRTFVGADSRVDWDLGDFLLQPEARLGYRFELLNDPVKLHAAFVADPVNTAFTIRGPDPARGNVVAGATLGASTDTFSLGVNFDWVRGSNGSSTEVGTFSLLGRI